MCPQCKHKSGNCGRGQSETKFYITIPDDFRERSVCSISTYHGRHGLNFLNIYRLLLHYLYICIKSLLHYLFLILYFCTLLSSIYWSVLSVTPIFASFFVISIYLIYDLNFHFKQYIPCFARIGVEGNLGLYFVDDSQDVILTTQHEFTMMVSVKLDKYGHSYFNADLWRKCLSVMNGKLAIKF